MNPDRYRRRWTFAGAAVLASVLAVAVGGALASGDMRPGRLRAIAFASGICLAGSLTGWLAGRIGIGSCQPARAVAAALAAVGLRIFPPLAALAWLGSAGGEWRENGTAEWLLIFYLALLATDIVLNIIWAHLSGARPEN